MKILRKSYSFSNIFLLGTLFIAFCLLSTSCTKQNIKEEQEAEELSALQEEQEQIQYEFFLDNQSVAEGTFDPTDQNLIIAVTGEDVASDPTIGIIKIWAFSSEALYIAWGEANDLPVACMLEMEDHLRTYASTSGAISYYEQTGAILPSYEQYATNYIATMNCIPGTNQSVERALAILYKDAYGGVPNFGAFGVPFLWSGWNNQISRMSIVGLPSATSIFDKTFYRKRLATLWGLGWRNFRFIGSLSFLNDRTSSFIAI